MTFAEAILPDMQLGLVKQSAGLPPIGLDTYAAGRIGLGFEELEAGVVHNNRSTYPNVVSQLVANDFIETKAYSLWLGSVGMDLIPPPLQLGTH